MEEGENMTHKQAPLFPDEPDRMNVLRELDRAEVEPLAFKILATISPYCERAEVAGSIRRRRPAVNDIDIVVQPKSGYWLQIVKEIRREFDAVTGKQGEKLATLFVPFASKQGQGHVQLDFYRASQSTWGALLLVRTGSKEHNIYLCNLAIRKGLRLQYSRGLVDKDGNVVAGKTEEEIFEALGLSFIAPQDREK